MSSFVCMSAKYRCGFLILNGIYWFEKEGGGVQFKGIVLQMCVEGHAFGPKMETSRISPTIQILAGVYLSMRLKEDRRQAENVY